MFLRSFILFSRLTVRVRSKVGFKKFSLGRRWLFCVCSWSRFVVTGELGSRGRG